MNRFYQFLVAALLFAFATSGVLAKTKIACIGNSITYGYLLSSPATQSYPARLQALLGAEYEVGNYGVSARTMLKKGDRPYWNEAAYSQAKASNPDIVIIMLGTNDAKLAANWTPHKNEFNADYKAMISAFRNLSSKPEVWVCKIVPAYKVIWDISNTTILNQVNPAIAKVAAEAGTHLIDMYTAMENSSNLFQSDGIHPTSAGAQAMANYISSCLRLDTLSVTSKDGLLMAPTGYKYQWYLNGVAIAETAGGNDKELTPTVSGIYKVAVQASELNTTMIMTDTITFDIPTLVDKNPTADVVSVVAYPNPCAQVLNFDMGGFKAVACTVKLFSVDGRLALDAKAPLKDGKMQLDVSPLLNGIYYYTVVTDNRLVTSGKINVASN